MGVSLSWSVTVTNDSAVQSTVKVVLKATTSGASYNNTSPSGYITIGGTKYTFSHNIPQSKTTTLATKSKSFSRIPGNQSIAVKASFSTGISAGTLTKSGTATVPSLDVYGVYWYWDSSWSSVYASTSVYYGYAATHPSISKTGYNFTGWNGAYAAGTSTGGIGATTYYYATWSPITYSIAYDLNGGSEAPNSTYTTSYNIQQAVTIPDPIREGYTFTGWTGSNGTTPQTNLSIPVGSTGNRTYTANWEINKYQLILNTNNHDYPDNWSWPADSDSSNNKLIKTHGINIALPDWGEGHVNKSGLYQLFAGWSVTIGSTNVAIDTIFDRDGEAMNDSFSLTANWSDAVRSIILHYSDSATTDNQVTIFQPFNQAIALPRKTTNNYAFKGWHISSGLSPTSNPTYPVSTNMNFTDYDAWFMITQDTEVVEDKKYYTKNNSTGVYTESNPPAGSDPSANGYYEMIQQPSAMHLYAVWNPTCTVIFNRNDPNITDGFSATGSVASQTVENGQSFTFPTPSYSRRGYSALGWAYSSSATTSNYVAGNTLTLNDITPGYKLNFYAVWTPLKYQIILTRGGASGSDKTFSNLPYWSTFQLPSDLSDSKLSGWSYPNYSLSGWLRTDYSPSSVNRPGTNLVVNQSLTYAAQWSYKYNVPKNIEIETARYLDSNYTILNNSGKYLKIHATGINGSYTGVSISNHTYKVDVKFYNTDNVGDDILPVATYTLDLTSTGNNFEATWGTVERPLFDKGLNMAYCTLTIKDTTNYHSDFSLDDPSRIITFVFDTNLERAIGFHIADDVSAISMFRELQEGDKGLVVRGPVRMIDNEHNITMDLHNLIQIIRW